MGTVYGPPTKKREPKKTTKAVIKRLIISEMLQLNSAPSASTLVAARLMKTQIQISRKNSYTKRRLKLRDHAPYFERLHLLSWPIFRSLQKLQI